MHYKYLKQWVIENTVKDLSFHNISRFEDQYLIAFRGHKKALQISFSSAEQFIFLNEDHQIIDFIPFDNSSLIMTHLKHSKIENISIDDDDRIIYIYFTKYNIYNVLETIVIVLELISKYTNLILCRVKDDKFIIIDSLKKISFAENQTRQILPNIEYKKPTTSFQLENTNFEYPLYIKNMKVSCETHKQAYFDMNALFFDLYFEHLIKHKIETFKKQKIKQISKIIKRNENKLEKLANELFSEDYAYELKKKAELLITFQNQIPQNASKVALNDYYHEDYPLIEIELDKKLNLKQNIENYFKKFKKALSGRQIVEEQIKKTKKEISLLKEEIADIEEIDTLAQINSNYEQDITKNREKALFRKLEINDDWEILIGRSNTENDQLTCKTAKPDDWWFHTRIFKGTHVVLRNFKKQELPINLLYLCAKLAAWYSKAKTSINVPVDYTQIRYVRKPKGSPKGYVVYTKQKTVYVNPLPFREAAEQIKRGDY